MCGLVGVISDKGYIKADNRKAFFTQSLYVDALRGFDSTGFFLAPTNPDKDDLIIKKKALPASDFLDMFKIQESLKDFGKYKYAIGHNRAATRGGVSHRTAHPFNHGDITLVHNGTLTTTLGLPGDLNFSVDSEVITHAFNKESPEDIIPELRGAFALIWHDTEDDTISVIRNDERPLSFGIVEKENTILLGSEYRMIDWLANRNGLELSKMYTLSKGRMLTFNGENPKDYTTKDIKLHKKVYAQNYDGYGNYGNNYNNRYNKRLPNPNSKLTKRTKGLFSVDELLKELGLKMGIHVDFDPTAFHLYNEKIEKPRFGYLIGKLGNTSLNHELRATSLKEDEWAWTVADEKIGMNVTRVTGKVINAHFDPKLNQITVYLSETELYDFEDEEEAFEKGVEELKKKIKELDKEASSKKKDGQIVSSRTRDNDKRFAKGPRGRLMTEKEWDLLTNKGCALCTGNVDFKDAPRTGWTADEQPVCYQCMAGNGWDFHQH